MSIESKNAATYTIPELHDRLSANSSQVTGAERELIPARALSPDPLAQASQPPSLKRRVIILYQRPPLNPAKTDAPSVPAAAATTVAVTDKSFAHFPMAALAPSAPPLAVPIAIQAQGGLSHLSVEEEMDRIGQAAVQTIHRIQTSISTLAQKSDSQKQVLKAMIVREIRTHIELAQDPSRDEELKCFHMKIAFITSVIIPNEWRTQESKGAIAMFYCGRNQPSIAASIVASRLAQLRHLQQVLLHPAVPPQAQPRTETVIDSAQVQQPKRQRAADAQP
ncbi:MAG: hypothetical protein WCF65_01220 [Parachlamydiaceae bacterium]